MRWKKSNKVARALNFWLAFTWGTSVGWLPSTDQVALRHGTKLKGTEGKAAKQPPPAYLPSLLHHSTMRRNGTLLFCQLRSCRHSPQYKDVSHHFCASIYTEHVGHCIHTHTNTLTASTSRERNPRFPSQP